MKINQTTDQFNRSTDSALMGAVIYRCGKVSWLR
jgi:tRNA1(Val) A37 N6-methylase TrmN6